MPIRKRRKKFLRVFLVFGALSGCLMSDVSSAPTDLLGDVVDVPALWFVFGWLWARDKSTSTKSG